MNCVLRSVVCAFSLGFLVFSHNTAALAKSEKDRASASDNVNTSAGTRLSEFKWNGQRKLTWDDFRGPVTASDDMSAAATHCSIGFTTARGADGNQKVIVYNTFYANMSWVRPDARIQSILDHEQGHFDLCELYTRVLRQRMANFNFDVADVRGALMSIYDQVTKEYEDRQQAYEAETTHGTNIAVQHRWMASIANELSGANMVAFK